jgi:membrane associated rhomboid family serine protease
MTILEDLKTGYRYSDYANKLLYWNVAVFILSFFFYDFRNREFIFPDWLALSSNPLTILSYFWTLLTYSFLHSGFLHLIFNLLTLSFYSRLFLTFFSPKQFIGLYLLGAIFSGASFVIAFLFSSNSGSLVGASGAIMTVLVATTTYQPLMSIRLLIFGTIKLWYLTVAILIINLLEIFGQNTGGIVAHLGGALFGFMYVKLLQNGTDMSLLVTKISSFFGNLFDKKTATPFKKIHKNKTVATKTNPRVEMVDKKQQQVDEILDKISASGYDSLTAREKEFLFNAGKS